MDIITLQIEFLSLSFTLSNINLDIRKTLDV